MSLSVLEEPRTFPPKLFFLIVWLGTLLFSLFGVVVSRPLSVPFMIWSVVTIIALRQIWRTQWTRLDREGITVRNPFGWRKTLRWPAITRVELKSIPVRKRTSFSILTIHGLRDGATAGETTRIVLDSDTVGFDALSEIVQGAAPSVPT